MLYILLHLPYYAVADVDYLVGFVGDAAFVGDYDYCHPVFPVQLGEEVHHFHAGLGVKGAGGLIGKDDAWAKAAALRSPPPF